MFITVSLGGMLAVTATAAATGAIAVLYVRAKTASLVAKAKSIVSTNRKKPIRRRWVAANRAMPLKTPKT